MIVSEELSLFNQPLTDLVTDNRCFHPKEQKTKTTQKTCPVWVCNAWLLLTAAQRVAALHKTTKTTKEIALLHCWWPINDSVSL